MKITNKYFLSCLILLIYFTVSENYSLTNNTKSPALGVSDSLHNIGHASMKIKTADGKIIYIDPFHTPGDYTDSADIILVTHGHGDHSNTNLVTKKATCVTITHIQSNIGGVYQTFNIDGIDIYSVPAYNQNHNINQCVGYVLEFNGIKLYHAGDTGNIPEMAELADSNITYALLPVDGVFTMSPEDATTSANMIEADYSIPMHTEPTPDDYNEEIVARFTPDNKLVVRNGESIALANPSTGINEEVETPSGFKLYQSYPNPFNPTTKIEFNISDASFVTLKVFDIVGKEVAVLVSERLPAGKYIKQWNANALPSGVYLYKIETGEFTDAKKVILLR